MGTRGYKVYRHKGRYFRWYNHYDSYPSGYGLKVLKEVPDRNATPEELQEWLTSMRKELDSIFDFNNRSDYRFKITEEQPQNDIMIEWVYEIDLDNLVFHVDSFPLFRLDHLPSPKLFLRGIGFDRYGHRSFTACTPKKYRYNWTAPPSPPEDSLLVVYRDHKLADGPFLIQDLLFLAEEPSNVELCRISLLELLVGHYMMNNLAGHSIRILENIPSRNLISEDCLRLLYSFLALALSPLIFPSEEQPVEFEALSSFVWLREDVCLRITTHLNDEANLQAAVGELVCEVKKKGQNEDAGAKTKSKTIYGVAFSMFHCVIVTIDAKDEYKCKHSPALQFLPSWYAYSPSTPGITAIARLGAHLDSKPEAFSHLFRHVQGGANFVVMVGSMDSAHIISTIPLDVWENIVQYLDSPIDILTFGSLSPASRDAASRLLRYPHISVMSPRSQTNESEKLESINYRLLSPIACSLDLNAKDIQEEDESLDEDNDEGSDDDDIDDERSMGHSVLLKADFKAVVGRRDVVLRLGHFLSMKSWMFLSHDSPNSCGKLPRGWRLKPLECQVLGTGNAYSEFEYFQDVAHSLT